MRIAIFEMEHFEVAYPLIRLFDLPGNELTIFTSYECMSRIQEHFTNSEIKYQFVVKKQESKLAFIYTSYKRVREQQTELLILSTVSDNFIFYYLMISQLKSTRVVLTLHDINTFFHHKFSFSLRRLVRIAGKRLLIKKVKEFNVIAMPLVNELKQRLPADKSVHCLPGSLFERGRFPFAGFEKKEFLQLIVPGSIDEKRRNYEVVLDILQKIKEKALPVRVALLSTVDGDYAHGILKRTFEYGEQGHALAYYPREILSQEGYDMALQGSDVIFIPSVIQTVMSDDITETYGVTKSSGTIFDVVRHAKPFIIPNQLKIDLFLEGSAFRYDSVDDIIGFLEQLIANPASLRALQNKSLAASENYTIDKVRQRNPGLFG